MVVKVESGKRGTPSRRVRLEDVAARCGVSVSTASRALAGGKRPRRRANGNATAGGDV
ncbi:MAG: LacI family DNA-binding transcriptional regulator, partial [Mesorhizobium sp.]